jgi:hypothetical protein
VPDILWGLDLPVKQNEFTSVDALLKSPVSQ